MSPRHHKQHAPAGVAIPATGNRYAWREGLFGLFLSIIAVQRLIGGAVRGAIPGYSGLFLLSGGTGGAAVRGGPWDVRNPWIAGFAKGMLK